MYLKIKVFWNITCCLHFDTGEEGSRLLWNTDTHPPRHTSCTRKHTYLNSTQPSWNWFFTMSEIWLPWRQGLHNAHSLWSKEQRIGSSSPISGRFCSPDASSCDKSHFPMPICSRMAYLTGSWNVTLVFLCYVFHQGYFWKTIMCQHFAIKCKVPTLILYTMYKRYHVLFNIHRETEKKNGRVY
jgi:hypothetical protein